MTYVTRQGDHWGYPAMVQQGWQCPCCRRVYSPTIPMCFTCGQGGEVSTAEKKSEVSVDSVSPAEIRRWANSAWEPGY